MGGTVLVALTGTPGTGKSATARELWSRGYRALEVGELARAEGLLKGDEVDVDALARRLPPSGPTPLILVGHLSHLLPVDRAIVLRCHPEALRLRLAAQGWPSEKVQENVEAEAVDFVTIEAVEAGLEVYEVDTTRRTPVQVADAVEAILRGKGEAFRPGRIDWSEVILSWY